MDKPRLILGDTFDVLPTLAENSVDAVVVDPPYGLEFMGKEWDNLGGFRDPEKAKGDLSGRFHKRLPESFTKPAGAHLTKRDKYDGMRGPGKSDPYLGATVNQYVAGPQMQAWHFRWAREVYRVLKPGGHLVAFGGSRTYHRLACAVEDAGFEVRDQLQYLYGSGFPKSLDVSKAIDKAAGATREVIGQSDRGSGAQPSKLANHGPGDTGIGYMDGSGKQFDVTAPATDAARQWDGWGTALKPAHEPILLARKPLSEPTVAANVLRWGTGALNVDGCRIKTTGDTVHLVQSDPANRAGAVGTDLGITRADRAKFQAAQAASIERTNTLGRWPANIVLDEEAGRLLDEQAGERPGAFNSNPSVATESEGWGSIQTNRGPRGYADTGGPSRFYFTAKADSGERGEFNRHPTVKPVTLMRWLCRLVTPPNGLILDCFMGSGTTGVAALAEGFRFVGVEREPEYFAWAERRIVKASVTGIIRQGNAPAPVEEAQIDLFVDPKK